MKSSDDLHKNFKDYVESKWNEDEVYVQGDFTYLFGIDSRHARYHLLKLVEAGVLCSVSYKGRVYYMKRQHRNVFRQLEYIGVKVR